MYTKGLLECAHAAQKGERA